HDGALEVVRLRQPVGAFAEPSHALDLEPVEPRVDTAFRIRLRGLDPRCELAHRETDDALGVLLEDVAARGRLRAGDVRIAPRGLAGDPLGVLSREQRARVRLPLGSKRIGRATRADGTTQADEGGNRHVSQPAFDDGAHPAGRTLTTSTWSFRRGAS